MKIKATVIKVILILTLILIISCAFDSSKKTPGFISSSKIKVENVEIKEDSKFVWAVVGMIRNQSSTNIQGYVKIKFLNSNGDIVNTAKAKVNDGDTFAPGQAASFDYYTEPVNFDGVTDFDVEFIEK